MGLYKEGYLTVFPTDWSITKVSTKKIEGRERLWFIRFLNLLGGTNLAIKLLSQVELHTTEDFRVAGNIYLTSYNFPQSSIHFQKSLELETQKSSYMARMSLLGLTDSLAGLGEYNKAIKLLKSVKRFDDTEKLLQGIFLQAQGEYLAGLEKWDESRIVLCKAAKYYPQEEDTDHGFLYKWTGYVEAKLGNIALARKLFKKALSLLKQPALRAEAWLEVYHLMHKAGILGPRETELLIVYPQLSDGYLNRIDIAKGRIVLKAKKRRIWISPARNEWSLEGQHYYVLPKEILLLSALKQADQHGISLARLKTIIWPDELASYKNLESRIHQLLHRLKNLYGLTVKIRSLNAFLSLDSLNQIEVEVSLVPLPLTLFEIKKEFSAKEFAEFYGVNKTRGSILIKDLVETGTIEKISSTRNDKRIYSYPLK